MATRGYFFRPNAKTLASQVLINTSIGHGQASVVIPAVDGIAVQIDFVASIRVQSIEHGMCGIPATGITLAWFLSAFFKWFQLRGAPCRVPLIARFIRIDVRESYGSRRAAAPPQSRVAAAWGQGCATT
jgi:hypothetical protein